MGTWEGASTVFNEHPFLQDGFCSNNIQIYFYDLVVGGGGGCKVATEFTHISRPTHSRVCVCVCVCLIRRLPLSSIFVYIDIICFRPFKVIQVRRGSEWRPTILSKHHFYLEQFVSPANLRPVPHSDISLFWFVG